MADTNTIGEYLLPKPGQDKEHKKEHEKLYAVIKQFMHDARRMKNIEQVTNIVASNRVKDNDGNYVVDNDGNYMVSYKKYRTT